MAGDLSKPSGRDLRIDNAKGVLIFLVVLGHFIGAVGGWSGTAARLILPAMYLFHIPTFVFLAGVTAKADNLAERLTRLVMLLLVFQAAYVGFIILIAPNRVLDDPLRPIFLLWFLLALVWWTASLPLFKRLPPPLAMGGAVALALAAGCVGRIDNTLTLSRTFVFLPFFVAGALYGWRILSSPIPLWWARGAAVVALAAAAAVLIGVGIDDGWLLGSTGYRANGVGRLEGASIRVVQLSLAAVIGFFFLAGTSRAQSWLTIMGQRSLPIFLLHGFVTKTIEYRLPGLHDQLGEVGCLALALVSAAALCAVFCTPAFDEALRSFSALPAGAWKRLRPRTKPT